MDVALCVLWRFNLNHQIDVGDIDTSSGNISGYQDFEFELLESLEGYLSLVLSDVTVHYFDVVLYLVRQE